jgi:hypothetical protein
MDSMLRRLAGGVVSGALALCFTMCSSDNPNHSSVIGKTSAALSGFPQYDHVFVIINENHQYGQIIGNPAAPIINALANDYGLATQYTGVGDPSEPNYVAMLGGDTFGIASDDPYFFPGHTVNAENLMSQLDAAKKTWRGYFQDLPYAGYRGYCYPAKCNGIPDSDTQYVAKHNGIVNFANMQVPSEFAKQMPLEQLSDDLAAGNLPNFGYIVADECHDMHGAPPWCVDSGPIGGVDDVWLVSQGDQFVGKTVNMITSSAAWASGNNAIVVTFDEGNKAASPVVTIVVTNHGPRGVKDKTSYNHYSLLASLQQTFGLGCLLNSCTANAMTPLFQITGANDVPTLPAPFNPAPNGSDTVSAQGKPESGSPVSLTGTGWFQVTSPSLGGQDNNLAAVSAASASDVWAVGSYLPPTNNTVLAALGEHFDGKRWSAYPLPNVGLNENSLLAVSMLPSGKAWTVGYFVNANYKQKTLIEHFDGTTWSVVSSPSPGDRQNILYGVAAITDNDVWAVGAEQDSAGLWHTLSEQWDGKKWSVVPTMDPGSSGNQFYAVTAVSANSVYATGQQGGTGFPNEVLTEHWDGSAWSVLSTPAAPSGSPVPLGVSGTDTALSVVGDFETGLAPYTTFVAAGAPSALSVVSTPNNGTGENDLFATAVGSDGSPWAVGWDIDPSSGNHLTLVEEVINGQWTLVPSPSPGTGDSGLAGIAGVPAGGLWAVGVTTRTNGNFGTLILYHP